MNKLQELEAAIRRMPDEFNVPRNVMLNLLNQARLGDLRIYSLGLRVMALHLSKDEALLEPLIKIREILK